MASLVVNSTLSVSPGLAVKLEDPLTDKRIAQFRDGRIDRNGTSIGGLGHFDTIVAHQIGETETEIHRTCFTGLNFTAVCPLLAITSN